MASDSGKTSAQGVRESAAEEAEDLREQAKEQAERVATGFGGRAESIAGALHSAGDSLKGKEDWLANAAYELGGCIRSVSTAVRDQGLDGVRRSTEGFARQHPALFIGAAVLAGVAAGRILRSSAPEEHMASGDGRTETAGSDGSDRGASRGTNGPGAVAGGLEPQRSSV